MTESPFTDEPLSEDARVVLAFIRDHPGCPAPEIATRLAIDSDLVWKAIVDLVLRGLVIRHTKPIHEFPPRTASTIVAYFPA